jgi:hypothetical protein
MTQINNMLVLWNFDIIQRIRTLKTFILSKLCTVKRHKKCQNLTHVFLIDGFTQKVSKNETLCSISISREHVPKRET